MTYQVNNLYCCLMVVLTSYSQGLQFFMKTPPDGSSCGHLQCWADKLFTDPSIMSIFSLSVYEVTQPNTKTKLASLSVFDQDLSLDETKINIVLTTGNISDYHAELTLALKDVTACLNRSYLCQLDFVNVDAHHGSLQETVTPEVNGSCSSVFNQCAKVAYTIKSHSDNLEAENVQLKQLIEAIEAEMSKLQELVNSSLVTPQITDVTPQLTDVRPQITDSMVKCYKGEQYNKTREMFTLWDKVPALCDTVTDGGGWIIIQRRTKGDVAFYKGWADYKKGFGTTDTDFWFGLDKIHNLTLQGYTELRVDLEFQGKQYYAHYSNFRVDDESLNYRASASGYSGTAGDSLLTNNNQGFTTYDKENDGWVEGNCASDHHGAWWYNNCGSTNLNGLWGVSGTSSAYWFSLTSYSSASFSEMKIRSE